MSSGLSPYPAWAFLCTQAGQGGTSLPWKLHLKHSEGFLPLSLNVVLVQSLSHVRLFVPSWTAHQASLSSTTSLILLKLMSIESEMPSNHLILCHPLLLLPSIFPSIRVFSNELVLCIRWPKYWSFSFSINPSNEYSRLIFFRMDWFDLAVQEALKSLLQHHSLKASILCNSKVHIVKAMVLTRWTFFSKVMSPEEFID